MKPQTDIMLILIDKPKGITSHDVVDYMRKVTGIRKIGHAGTLDPNATGLLIIGVGRESTKKLGKIAKDTTKTYLAQVYLGEIRDTDDVEGKTISKTNNVSKHTIELIKKTLNQFVGESTQIPPIFSAIKIKGKKAYQIARKGLKPKIKPRKITIHSIKLVKYQFPLLTIECRVSSGTYIRSLARDIGSKLILGAYLKNLRRTKIGDYSVKNANKMRKLNKDNWEGKSV